jgi:RNA polymerase sigma-70 factor (sigma-E family)
MDVDSRAASPPAGVMRTRPWIRPDDPAEAITALYREQALGLIGFAHIMLGDRAMAEDVVHDAFCGLYRRWRNLDAVGNAHAYVRTSVLNGCRSALRGRQRDGGRAAIRPGSEDSAEAVALLSEERREVIRALWRLPERQREVLVLRYYLDLPDDQIARDLGLAASSVRSARRRALAALEHALRGM